MSVKGTTTTADYIEYDRVMNVASKLMKDDKTKLIGTYLIIAVNTGLRSGDILQLTYEQLQNEKIIY